MKKFNVTMTFLSVGTTTIEVPDELTLEQAIEYAKENIKSIPIPYNAEYVDDSDIIDEENCDFEPNFACKNCGEMWYGTRNLESEDYTEFCPECNSANIEEIDS